MHILLIGSGGREHALAWKIKKSPQCDKLTIMHGNGGTASLGENVAIKATDIDTIVSWALENKPDLVVIGPEDPLALGLSDKLIAEGFKVFGPSQQAAQMESSKSFAKTLMLKHGIPTGFAKTFTNYEEAKAYLDEKGAPIVIKASGLAAGKGVIVCLTKEEADKALAETMQDKTFGNAGDETLIEEYMEGPEVSYLTFVDNNVIVPMRPVCDYKRVFDGDQGPNTGGMGVYSPPGFFSKEDAVWVQKNIAEATLKALQVEGIEFKGILYIGLMMTQSGPRVIEFNARFGDPETEVLMPALQTDIVAIMLACIDGTLAETEIVWSKNPILGVILASSGYPGSYPKGLPIAGIEAVNQATVFHAGTRSVDGQILTDGGRVLCVVAEGKTMQEAREVVYGEVKNISFEGMQMRSDIGLREVQ